MAFSYIGQALTGDEFVSYVASYDFGTIPPSYLVIHHSANPDASWGPASADQATWWDRNEQGLSTQQVMDKRKRQLDSIMAYYRDSLGWTAGPHLFFDDRWVWLFTPMFDVGIHAASGNSYQDAQGLHYSIGIEVIGYYEQVHWPPQIEALLWQAVQALRARLQNFDLVYTPAPLNRPDLHDHQISFHADYNKPACPGGAVTPAYVIGVLSAAPGPSYRLYHVLSPCAVLTGPDPSSALAQGPNCGQVWLVPGQPINAEPAQQPGWVHVAPNAVDPPGIGFVPESYVRHP